MKRQQFPIKSHHKIYWECSVPVCPESLDPDAGSGLSWEVGSESGQYQNRIRNPDYAWSIGSIGIVSCVGKKSNAKNKNNKLMQYGSKHYRNGLIF